MNRIIRICAVSLLLATAATYAQPPAALPPGHQPGEEAAILALLDRYMIAISTRDLKAMAAMQMPDGMTYVARPKKDDRTAIEIVGRPNSYWVDPSQAEGPPLRERYWSPTVLVRGSIALAWAPYEFWEDGKTSHCGVDTFDLVKVDGQWRVANAMWTVEPQACAELRPVDASAIRPKD
jgi:hypothetical protein